MAWLAGKRDALALANALSEWLPRALEYGQAGFYFEEGGCVGMALALQEAFSRAGARVQLARMGDSDHVGVVFDGRFFDWSGFTSSPWHPLTKAQFSRVAKEWGHDEDKVEADKAWATELINTAVELAQESEA